MPAPAEPEPRPGPDLLDAVMATMSARTGHFLLESGHHGDLWLDLDGVFWSAAALAPLTARLGERIAAHDVDVLCGPLVGGALLAQLVAADLRLPFVHAERTSAGGPGLYSARYRVPDTLRRRLAGRRVALVDDVVNAGSAVRATMREVVDAGGTPVVLAALLVLGEEPARLAAGSGMALETLAARPGSLWEPADCPACRSGVPLAALG